MTYHRKHSLAAGLLYLLTFVSIPTLALYQTVKSAGFVVGTASDTGTSVGILLEIIVALAGLATALVLFPILKKQNHSLALGLVVSRTLEAGLIFAGTAFLGAIVTLRHAGAGADALASSQALAVLYDRFFLQSQSFLPAINDLLLGVLLYQSRLVPRTLAVIGIVGAFPLLAGYVAVLFQVVPQNGTWAGLAALLVALFEFSLGLWLVIRGFRPQAVEKLGAS